MSAVVSFFKELFSNFWQVVASDYHSFFLSFPETYTFVFVLVRVVPACLLLLFLPSIVRELRTKEISGSVFSFPRHSAVLVLLLFCVGFLLRFWFNYTTDAITYGTDAAARFMQAKEWYQDPEGPPGGLIWLPLYHLLILAFTPFGLDVSLSGRVSILLMSAFSVPLFYSIVRKVFNTPVAFWSALFLAINPFHIKYSSLYLSENMFLFFVLCAFYFLLRFLDSGKKSQLIFSALFINGATMLRYEGWLVAGLLPLFLFMKRKDIVLSVRYFALNCICIFFYLWLSITHTGVLIYGLYISDIDVKAELVSRPDKWTHIMSRLSSELVFPVWFYFMLIGGILYAIIKRIKLAYLSVWLILFSFTAYKVLTFTSQPFWRYFATALFMLIPYGAIWLAAIAKNTKRNFAITCLFVGVFSFPPLLESYTHRQELSRAPADYKRACRLLKTIRQPKEKVIVNIWIAGIDYASFQEDADINREQIYYPMSSWMKLFPNYAEFSDRELVRVMGDTSFQYVFVQKGLLLDSLLYSKRVTEDIQLSDTQLDTLYNSTGFQLLEIRRNRN